MWGAYFALTVFQERVKFHVLLTSYEMVLSERTLNKVGIRGAGGGGSSRGGVAAGVGNKAASSVASLTSFPAAY